MPDEETVAGIVLPEDLSALNDKELAKALAEIGKKFAPFNDDNKVITADDLVIMNTLVEQKERIAAEQTTRATAAAEVAEAARVAREKMQAGEAGEEEAPAEGENEEAPAEGEEAPAEDPSAPVGVPPEGEELTNGGTAAPEVPAQAGAPAEPPVAMAASAAPKAKGRATARPRTVPVAQTKVADRGSNLTIVASSDIPNVPTGKELDRDGLSEALHARARGLRDGSDQVLVASIVNNAPKNDVSKSLDDESIRKAWSKAHDQESMVASGGWCAPSETVYDFVCDFESLPDALDLPSVTSRRGGLRYPTSPLLADVYADVNSGFTWTEADDIAAAGNPHADPADDVTKPCFVIPCPSFDEVRLQAQGICVTAGNLTDRAYPELTNRYVDLVMTAHAHRMNALTVAKVVAASTDVTPTADADLGAAESTFGVVEFLINRFRDAFFASSDFILEGVLPRWARGPIRRDLARRNGVEWDQVTDAEIAAEFLEIGARVQFISNYQPLAANAVAYPTSVQMLLYPAGAHTRLDGGSLDLGVVRDSTLNATNDYTAAWTEEFWGVVSRCASYKTTIPVCASGNSGVQVAVSCPSV